MIRAALLATTLVGAWAILAHAQQPQPYDRQHLSANSVCGPLVKGLQIVHDKFHETVHWTGKSKNGTRAILTTSPEGTWTFFVSLPDQEDEEGAPIGCILASDGNGPAEHPDGGA